MYSRILQISFYKPLWMLHHSWKHEPWTNLSRSIRADTVDNGNQLQIIALDFVLHFVLGSIEILGT